MATAIPNPIRIACAECAQDARVEFQDYEAWQDTLVVAAECRCGRYIGLVDGILITGGWGTQQRPFIASTLRHNADIGTWAMDRVAVLRDRMATLERLIGAATWANEKPRKEPG